MLVRLVADLMEGLSLDGPHPPFELQSIPTDYREVNTSFHRTLIHVHVHWVLECFNTCTLGLVTFSDP